MRSISVSSLEGMFLNMCNDWFSSNNGYDVRGELGVFSKSLVCWLGVTQRLLGGSLQDGVLGLAQRLNSDGLKPFVNRSSKKLQEKNISYNTGGISRARDRFSLDATVSLFDSATQNIFSYLDLTVEKSPVYVLDGQVLAISRTSENLKNFGKTGNGMGELHFPRIRAVSAHEVRSGIAKKISVGLWKEHEATIAQRVLKQLPAGAIVVMDRGFDKPYFIRSAREQGLKVIVRLKNSFGAKLLGETSGTTASKEVQWETKSGKHGPESERGRVIKYTGQYKGFRSSEFFFFSTADDLTDLEVADLYRKRVRVEGFIRDLKQTLKMFFVNSKKPENVEKEIIIAYLTFNLIRAVMQDTANALDLAPERLSFSGTRRLLSIYDEFFARAKTKEELLEVRDRFRLNMYQAKLPLRKKQRNYPRVIKYPKDRYKTTGIFKPNEHGEGK